MVKISELENNGIDPLGYVTKIVAKSLDYVRRMTGFENFIDPSGSIDFSEYIVDNYPNLTLGDIVIFSKKISQGEYGKMYNKINLPDLIGWLNIYANRRANEICRIKKEQEKEKYRQEESQIDKEGCLRMAKVHESMDKKHHHKKTTIAPYKDLGDYLERNDIDEIKFFKEKKAKLDRSIEGRGYDLDSVPEKIYNQMYELHLSQFLQDQNAKLRSTVD